MKNIAVQKGLTHVINYLKSAGYRVFEFDTSQKNRSDFFDVLMRWCLPGLIITSWAFKIPGSMCRL